MGMSDRLESALSQDTHYIELFICFILWRLVVLLTQKPHSEISEPKDDADRFINYEHRDDNKRKKTENIDCGEHKQTCPKRKDAIKAQKQWMNT